jgi:hypothetical protein
MRKLCGTEPLDRVAFGHELLSCKPCNRVAFDLEALPYEQLDHVAFGRESFSCDPCVRVAFDRGHGALYRCVRGALLCSQ